MKKTLLLLVLAFGICSINGSAQTKKQNTPRMSNIRSTQQDDQVMKFRQVEADGYVWFKLKRGNLFGARDSDGNNIIPVKYDKVEYHTSEISGYHYFTVKKGDYEGAFTREGTLVISPDKHYNYLVFDCSKGRICWDGWNRNSKKHTIFDAKGKEVFSIECDRIFFSHSVHWGPETLKRYPELPYFQIRFGEFEEKSEYMGICDLNGKIILQPEKRYHSLELRGGGTELAYWDQDGEYHAIPFNYSPETQYDYNPYESLYYAFKKKPSNSSISNSTSTTSSTTSNSTSNNNSGNKTTTVVVEHHRDPVPVQDWVSCSVCGHNPGVCQTCVGNKTNYRGDPCISCRGTGKCHFCNGQGGRYQIVYR